MHGHVPKLKAAFSGDLCQQAVDTFASQQAACNSTQTSGMPCGMQPGTCERHVWNMLEVDPSPSDAACWNVPSRALDEASVRISPVV